METPSLEICNIYLCDPVQDALGEPVLAGGLDWMFSRGPFHPRIFFDSASFCDSELYIHTPFFLYSMHVTPSFYLELFFSYSHVVQLASIEHVPFSLYFLGDSSSLSAHATKTFCTFLLIYRGHLRSLSLVPIKTFLFLAPPF